MATFDGIFLILVGNKDMHDSLGELEFQPDLTTDYRVSRSLASKNQFCHFFSLATNLILVNLVPRKCITSWICFNFSQIRPQTTELAATECIKCVNRIIDRSKAVALMLFSDACFGVRSSVTLHLMFVHTFPCFFSYLRAVKNILMTLLAGSQVSDRCPLCYLS